MAEIYCLNYVLAWIFILFPEQHGNLANVYLYFKSKIKPSPSMASPKRCALLSPLHVPQRRLVHTTRSLGVSLSPSQTELWLPLCFMCVIWHLESTQESLTGCMNNAWGDRWIDDQYWAIRIFPAPEKKLCYTHFDYLCLAFHSSFEKGQGWAPKAGTFFFFFLFKQRKALKWVPVQWLNPGLLSERWLVGISIIHSILVLFLQHLFAHRNRDFSPG